MKKLLALTVAALMALSMAACEEKDDDEDEKDDKPSSSQSDVSNKDDSSKDDASSEDDSSEDDSSKDDSSEDDSSEDDSSEDDSSEDDSSDDDDDDTITSEAGEIVDGVIVVGDLRMTVDDSWEVIEMSGNTYFVPEDYLDYGNNVNIIRSQSDDMFSLYTEELMTTQMTAMLGDDFAFESFENTTIDGEEALIMSYEYSSMTITQAMINTDDASYVVTFTGMGGTFDNVTPFIDSITIE